MLRPSDLDAIQSLTDVLAFLANDLDWPVNADDLDDATFEYTARELGVPDETVRDLTAIKQLRPLVPDQPWGIFFLEFSGPRLPLVQLRRLLQSLVERKRRSKHETRTWALDDLLFVVMTGDQGSVEMHLVAFADDGDGSPTIRTLEWRPGDTPQRRMQRLCKELLPRLEWPADETLLDEWRQQWRDAFRLRHGEAIRDARRLAQQMADVAKEMRYEIALALAAEEGTGSLSDLLQEFREQLLGDVTAEKFADTAAQTLVYGLLTNRISDPEGFGASPTLSALPLANPFLAAFFDRILSHVEASAAAEDSLEQLVADLRTTNVEAVLDEFGGTLQGGDPVIHLYEEFLAAYDRVQRADSGAFYTPLPIVRFMIEATDRMLRDHFGLTMGIADAATWSEVGAANGFSVPPGIDPDSRFVSVIDPGAGTGTFLVEWIRHAKVAFLDAGDERDWPNHLRQMVLPSLHGFELNPAAYAIAHVKLALECHAHDVAAPDDVIVLTSTLDHAGTQQSLLPSADPVAAQGERAAVLKNDVHFTVVIGNPPYDREERATDATGPRKGGVVRHGAPGVAPLINRAIDPLRQAGLGRHAKNVYNDYAYFWLWSTWQATENPSHPGIVTFITASSWVDGVSFGGLRHHLRERFDHLYVIDLAGDGRSARADENVFDIRTPVAIAIGVRTGHPSRDTVISHTRIEGGRQEKFARLAPSLLSTLERRVDEQPNLAPITPAGSHEALNWPRLTDLFPWSHSGSQFKRTWPISPERSTLERRWHALLDAGPDDMGAALRETGDRTVDTRVSGLLDPTLLLEPLAALDRKAQPEGIEPYGYRSFDCQWVIADKRLADRPRPELWAIRGDRQVFFASITSTPLGRGPAMTCSAWVPDLDFFCGRGARNIFPLWQDHDLREPNVSPHAVAALSEAFGDVVAPESLFAYTYGLLGTSAYMARLDEFFAGAAQVAPIPMTRDYELFAEVAALGAELIWLHTFGERFGEANPGDMPPGSATEVIPITAVPDTIGYSPETQTLQVGDGAFHPVSPGAWAFEVSGLRVLRSWLGYRLASPAGRRSSPLDEVVADTWTHSDDLCQLIAVIERTIELEPRAAALLDRVLRGAVIGVAEIAG